MQNSADRNAETTALGSQQPLGDRSQVAAPTLSLPKGGGAIRGIGEKFAANPVTGTGSMSVPIATSPGRSGFGPQLSLSYDSGSGNGPFGFGWSLSLPSITRKTDKGLPRYWDAEESDIFILSGAEDLVPIREAVPPRTLDDAQYTIVRYRPRIEGLFARIERWTNVADTADTFWRSIAKDNVTTWYGKTAESRITDPEDSSHIFSWLLCESYDDKGNVIAYKYKLEDSAGIDLSQAHERNRTHDTRSANRYLKRIRYGNHTPYFPKLAASSPWPTPPRDGNWLFEVVFDYGEHDANAPQPGDDPAASNSHIWPVRNDSFSSYRAGFEVRTYRLCQRVLMFHHFPGEPEVGADCLVRSTDFNYSYEKSPTDTRNPIFSFLLSVTQAGYKRKALPETGYLKRSLPPVEFIYSEATIQEEIREVDRDSAENLPIGLDGSAYQWVDLDGEGLSGILTEQADGWFYKRNLSPINVVKTTGSAHIEARFAPVELVGTKPALSLGSGHAQFLDLAGDGQLDLVTLRGPTPGFYERTQDEGWEPFIPFGSLPVLDWDDPNLKFVDLTGDGHADVLISEDDVFCWHPSLAEDGFGPRETARQSHDEEQGPKLVFADATQSIYLADLSGDGLTDLVRIRNGEVCYWPNLGYGRFGAKVTMDNAPWFDAPDLFDQKRIRLADIDGSGTTDILYLGAKRIDIYRNLSGNGWSANEPLTAFPHTDNVSSVQTVDLLGNGTACLAWSSPLPGDARRPMRYVDLMGGQKPHLLVKTVNNLGAETRVKYAPSTKFYLADKYEGKPWITKLPFPVHVVERVETYDHISRNRFVTRYAYHHGYFDGVEREFRGFGMVEQWDTEEFAALSASDTFSAGDNIEKASHVPPVWTKTWFHTGVYINRDHISNFFAGLLDDKDVGEYYREPGLTDMQAKRLLLEDTLLPPGLKIEEEREACRSLKGSMLRQEVYALDGTDKEPHPYTVTEQNFSIQRLQPRAGNRHAVFFTHAREAINYHYERNPTDPRITHALTLKVDEYGNVLRSIAVGYQRADVPERQPEQNETHLTLTLNRIANRDDQPDWRHIGLPVETRTYEVVKPPTASLRFAWEEPRDLIEALVPLEQVEPSAAKTIPYEQWDWRKQWNPQTEPGGLANTRLRLIEHVRTLYRPDDLGEAQTNPLALLPLGTVEPLALPGESYKLAFTPGLVAKVYHRPLDVVQPPGLPSPENLLPNSANVIGGQAADLGGYVDLDNNGHWWIPSGRMFYSPGSADTSAQELAFASQHFFLPHRYRDPFHTNAVSTESFVSYDAYDLLILKTRDALGNCVTVGERDAAGALTTPGNDYRVLQPRLMMDPNRNRTAVAFDVLGMVIGTAVMGKPLPAPVEGDSLDGFEVDLTEAAILGHLANPMADPQAILRRATTRLVYDLFAYYRTKDQGDPQPTVVYTLARETHDAGLALGQQTKVQHSFSYSDGFGREIQKKIQAEPGPLVEGGPVVSPRWVGSGWTIFNNKGKPVCQYEPFFSQLSEKRHRFEFGVQVGVSPILFYDPVERVVATLHPNHSYEKVGFDPWHQATYDVNDTVVANGTETGDPRTDTDIEGYVAEYLKAQPNTWKTWHHQRITGAKGGHERIAAEKAAKHANTPTTAYFDTLGRPFLTVAHNRFERNNSVVDEKYATRVTLDIEGNQREARDAVEQNGDKLGRIVMRYDYDMLGNRIHQASMEAGERWVLNDVAGKPIRAWDSRGHAFRTEYDPLRRPLRFFVTGADPVNPNQELLTERLVYGEQYSEDELCNLRGKLHLHLDQAGVVTNEVHDFKGNLLRASRRLAREYKQTINWSAVNAVLPANSTTKLNPAALEAALAPQLEADTFTSRTTYDALNRPVQLIAPRSDQPGAKRNVIQLVYNEANLLERVHVWLDHPAEPAGLLDAVTVPPSPVGVNNLDYDAKGQRLRIEYKNGATTRYAYDPETFRLIHLYTRRGATFTEDCGGEPPPPRFAAPDVPPNDTPCGLQNLHYTYDPVGNITHIRDDAQQTIYFNNQVVTPSNDYTYDAIYRLIEATGREHLGQIGGTPIPHSHNDQPRVGIDWSANDGNAMGTYIEQYVYDAVGNFLSMQHRGSDPAHPGWSRTYDYDETSLIEDGTAGTLLKTSNRLSRTTVDANNPTVEPYRHDAHGNMIRMPHLGGAHPNPNMHWNYKDQLRQADLGGGGTAYFVYDAAGQRTRKVWEKSLGPTEERIYLGSFEFFRRRGGAGALTLERETLHIMDDKRHIAVVETRTQGNEPGVPAQLIRYQFGNHLGSASLELDDQAQIVSYEEYTPYGSTSYQAVRSQTETPKRYRYTGKERDDEIGLYYHGARYFAGWFGRWVSCDPAGVVDGPNLYRYARNTPVLLNDPNGMDPDARSYQERSIQLNMNHDTSSGAVGYRLTIELQNPNTGDRYVYSSSGDVTGLRSVHEQLLGNSGFAEALRPEEREGLFSSLENFAQSVGPVPVAGQAPASPAEGGSSRQVEPVERGLQVVGDAARGIAADRALPQRYRLEPPRGATVTGIRDTQAGRVRGTPPRPVGAPVIRVDQPHGSTNYPHVNVETLNPDPHVRISPGALRAAGGLARGLEAVGRVARPLAIVTDTARLGVAVYEDEGIGRNTARTAASVAGGWAGAFAGAWVGAKAGAALGGLLGSFVPVLGNAAGAAIGGLLGGLIGGIAGGFFGSSAGEHAADAILE